MKFETKELTPKLWPDIEKVFGTNGACGGCWCMSWRRKKGEDWNQVKGKTNKTRFRRLVTTGKAHGILAYDGLTPIGWCSFDKRIDFEKIERSPSLKCDDGDDVWSIPCFFIKKEYRGRGVGAQFLAHALRAVRGRGGHIAEGYPVKSYNYGKAIPAAFAWTGTQSMFKKAGFKIAGNRDGGRQRVRKEL